LANNPPVVLKTATPFAPDVYKVPVVPKPQVIQNNNAPSGIVVGGGTVNGGATVNNYSSPPLVLKPTVHVVPTDREGLVKTEILIHTNQQISGPFQIHLDFDNPVSSISANPLHSAMVMFGGITQTGVHAIATVSLGIRPENPLLVIVYSAMPVKLVGIPRIE
jgi:hypothetical protein